MEKYTRTEGFTYYQNSIANFIKEENPKEIVDFLTESDEGSEPAHLSEQRSAWLNQIKILQKSLVGYDGFIIFEYSIARLNQRIDVVLLMEGIVFSLEFKNFKETFEDDDINQADGYGYGLKNFHTGSYDKYVVPMLIATRAPDALCSKGADLDSDLLFSLLQVNPKLMMDYIKLIQKDYGNRKELTEEEFIEWIKSPFKATPTIIESARSIYSHNTVGAFNSFDAGQKNLSLTENAINSIIKEAKENKKKIICFVTGVPGAGKTLVGLDIAGKERDDKDTKAIFFSGNGPLVSVLTEALGRDAYEKNKTLYPTRYRAVMAVKAFIQDLHAYKQALINSKKVEPDENVLIFDEAQRVWDQDKLHEWLVKKGKGNLPLFSEADLLLDSLKNKEWGVIVALVGLGQDIHVGENGLRTWFNSLLSTHKDWEIRLSNEIFEQSADQISDLKEEITGLSRLKVTKDLHLTTSLRTPRAKNLSVFVEALLNNRQNEALEAANKFENYQIYITRDLNIAKQWIRSKTKRKERCGMIISSYEKNLKSVGIKRIPQTFLVPKWFLDTEGSDSSNALEVASTQFDNQGLEIDWALLGWDMDMSYRNNGWVQEKLNTISRRTTTTDIEKQHILNGYRVLLTRARKGMIIYIPKKCDVYDKYDVADYFDSTYNYLVSCGFEPVEYTEQLKKTRIELPF